MDFPLGNLMKLEKLSIVEELKSRRLGMTISNPKALAKAVSFDSDNMWVELADGRQLGIPLAYFPRLANASLAQRKKYTISGGGIGLHWDDLNEDISVPGLLMGQVDNSKQAVKIKRRAA